MQFTPKINKDGTYRPFFGWTVVSNVSTDLSMLHNYLKLHNTLSPFFFTITTRFTACNSL